MSERKNNKLYLQLISIYYWFIFLMKSDSYYGVYLLIGICGIVSLYINLIEKRRLHKNMRCYILLIGSIFFSLMVVAANYALFLNLACPDISSSLFSFLYKGLSVIGVFFGGYFIFSNILVYLADKLNSFFWEQMEYKYSPSSIYLISWIILSIINISILFLCKYPGNVGPDSFTSINQSLANQYTNHHPFYYTMVIKLFLNLGIGIFNNINVSIALYSVFQIVFMAACFSFTIVTLYQMNLSLKMILCCWIWYTIMPFHILYSFTMWKDVMFGGFVLLFVSSMFRVLKGIGKYQITNYILLTIGSAGTCLFRSNGWFVFVLTFCCFVFLFGKGEKKVCRIFAGVMVFTFILKNPVLNWLGVTPIDTIEYLSVPAQQIARVINDCNDISEEEKELLNKIVDVEEIPDSYVSYISDPIKNLVRKSGQQEYLVGHKKEYIKLYFKLGIAHPWKYVEAWIDLTKGYWNGGYMETTGWEAEVRENDLGIKRIVSSKRAERVVEEYLYLYSNGPLQIFKCIGFHVWIIMGLGILSIIRKNKVMGIVVLLNLFIVLSLMITTPVYSTLRYVYPIFCCFPFSLFATFYQKNVDNAISIK